MTISIDEDEDVPRALAYLKRVNAKFQHFHWADTLEVLREQLGTNTPPGCVVFGRDGKVAKVFTNTDGYGQPDVEKLVQKLLN